MSYWMSTTEEQTREYEPPRCEVCGSVTRRPTTYTCGSADCDAEMDRILARTEPETCICINCAKDRPLWQDCPHCGAVCTFHPSQVPTLTPDEWDRITGNDRR